MFDMRVERVVVNATASGDNMVLAARGAGIRFRVPCGLLVAAGAVSAKFTDGAGGAELTGAMALAANGILPLSWNPEGYFETTANTALVLNLSAGNAVRGVLTVYVIRARGE